MKATLAQLHRDTAKLLGPVMHKKTLVITECGKARAKIIPLPRKPDRKKALAILRSMSALTVAPRR